MLKYHQKSSNSCCLGSLASAFHSIVEERAATSLVNHIEESLTLHTDIFRNRIYFAIYIMKNKLRHKGEQRLGYNPKRLKKGAFDILNDISENVTLVQLMDSLENFNHAISIVFY